MAASTGAMFDFADAASPLSEPLAFFPLAVFGAEFPAGSDSAEPSLLDFDAGFWPEFVPEV